MPDLTPTPLPNRLSTTLLILLIGCFASCSERVPDDAGTGKTRHLLAGGELAAAPPEGAIILLSANDKLQHWRHEREPKEPLLWRHSGGELTIVPGSGSIVTKNPVHDFRLHLEFKTGGDGGNSGIYIQRRYELQILDHEADARPHARCGAIYQYRAPDIYASSPAGEWQSYDIVFRSARWEAETKTENARLTVYLNGALIHDDVPLPDKTGSGRDESPAPQPLKLQEHDNAVTFRNIWLVPLEL